MFLHDLKHVKNGQLRCENIKGIFKLISRTKTDKFTANHEKHPKKNIKIKTVTYQSKDRVTRVEKDTTW